MTSKTLILNHNPIEIDKQIISCINWLNGHRYTTLYSCSGHSKKESLYIIFSNLDSLQLDKLLASLNRYTDASLNYVGHNRYYFELEGPKRLKKLRKIIQELKHLEPLKKIPLDYFG